MLTHYEKCLDNLLTRTHGTPIEADVLVLECRFRENMHAARTYGTDNHAERAAIIDSLNRLCLQHYGKAFADLIGRSQTPITAPLASDNIYLQIIQARARLNTLIDIAQEMHEIPPWLKARIQEAHDRVHELKLQIMRL